MGTMNRFTERDSPESQRVSHFQRCGTRLPHSTPLTRCGSATRGPTMRFMERFHVKIRRAMGAMNQRGSLGQQRKAQISNHKKIQQQSIKT